LPAPQRALPVYESEYLSSNVKLDSFEEWCTKQLAVCGELSIDEHVALELKKSLEM
jgi:hypothetical protein